MAVDTMPVADIKVRDGFNARQVNGIPLAEQDDTIELAGSIKHLGVTTPVTIDTDGYLVAGHRRVAAAKLAGITDIPYIVEDGDEQRKLAVHGAENIARKDLSPAEEAALIGRMLKLGYTADGAAEALGMSKARVTRRLVLLDIPEDLRALWGPDGTVSLDVATPVAALVSKVPKLAPLILFVERSRQETEETLQQGPSFDDDPDGYYEDEQDDGEYDDDGQWIPPAPPLDQLLREPIAYLARLHEFSMSYKSRKRAPKWPADFITVTLGARIGERGLEDLGVPAAVQQKFAAVTEKLQKANVYTYAQMSVVEADMDAARAAGVTIVLGNTEFIHDIKWLKARVKSDMLPRFEQEVDEQLERGLERTERQRAAASSDSGGQGELSSYEQQRKDRQRRDREKEKEWKPRAAAVNEDLGAALLRKWGEVKPDAKIVKIFVEASIGKRPPANAGYGDVAGHRSAAKLAAAGLRYVMPGWATVVPTPTKANPNKTRTDYLPIVEAEAKLWEWFDKAKTVEEIIGRGVIIHTAAMFANEHVVAQSHRVAFNDSGTVELPKDAAERLRKLVERTVPASVKKLAEEMKEFGNEQAAAYNKQAASWEEPDPDDVGDADEDPDVGEEEDEQDD